MLENSYDEKLKEMLEKLSKELNEYFAKSKEIIYVYSSLTQTKLGGEQ